MSPPESGGSLPLPPSAAATSPPPPTLRRRQPTAVSSSQIFVHLHLLLFSSHSLSLSSLDGLSAISHYYHRSSPSHFCPTLPPSSGPSYATASQPPPSADLTQIHLYNYHPLTVSSVATAAAHHRSMTLSSSFSSNAGSTTTIGPLQRQPHHILSIGPTVIAHDHQIQICTALVHLSRLSVCGSTSAVAFATRSSLLAGFVNLPPQMRRPPFSFLSDLEATLAISQIYAATTSHDETVSPSFSAVCHRKLLPLPLALSQIYLCLSLVAWPSRHRRCHRHSPPPPHADAGQQ